MSQHLLIILLCISSASAQECNFAIKDCDEDYVHTPMRYYVYSANIYKCKLEGKSFTWTLKQREPTKMDTVLTKYAGPKCILTKDDIRIDENSVYDLVVTVNGFTATCTVTFRPETPQPKVDSVVVNVAIGESKVIDMSQSDSDRKVEPKYSVDCILRKTKECEDEDCPFLDHVDEFRLKFTQDECTELNIITALFAVGDEDSGEYIDQWVLIESPRIKANISCVLANCEYAKDFKFTAAINTEFTVKCEDCEKEGFTTWTWTLLDLDLEPLTTLRGKSTTATVPGRYLKPTEKFVLKAESLSKGKPLTVYYAIAVLDERSISCQIKPLEGFSCETIFELNCDASRNAHYFQLYPPFVTIYQTKRSEQFLLSASSNIKHHKFFICTDKEEVANLIYHIHGSGSVEETKVADIQIRKRPLNKELVTNYKRLCERYSEELDVKTSALFLLATMSSLIPENKGEIDQTIVNTVPQLMEQYFKKPPLEYSEYITLKAVVNEIMGFVEDNNLENIFWVCSMIMDLDNSGTVMPKNIKFDELPYNNLDKCKLTTTTETTTESETTVEEMTRTLLTTAKTTPVTVGPGGDIIKPEDYPIYDDDINVVDANTILPIMRHGEQVKEDGKNYEAYIYKDYTNTFAKREITCPNVSLQLKFKKQQSIGVSMTRFFEKLPGEEFIDTPILNIDFYKGKRKIPNPGTYKIVFDIVLDVYNFTGYNASAKPHVKDEFHDKNFNMDINVHRIIIPAGSTCSFHIKIPRNVSIKYIFTRNKRPSYGHFKDRARVRHLTEDVLEAHMYCPFDTSRFDSFIYVGILPGDAMMANLTVNSTEKATATYEVKFTELICLQFDLFNLQWESSFCHPSYIPRARKMTCLCKHATLHAGAIIQADHKLEPLILVHFEIYQTETYMIVAALLCVYAFFCFILLFSPFRRIKTIGRDKIIYTSDNLKNDLYAYLIIIKTGNYAFCGTTSNVMLQLYGEENDSAPHVLNYPDPENRMCQRDCEDWYVLSTDRHLGNLESVELWTDLIGFRPAWFCENVLVVDLQTEKTYFFNVQKWLTLSKTANCSVRVDVSKVQARRLKFMNNLNKNVRFYFNAENIWNIFSNTLDIYLSYEERCTILLSILLTHILAAFRILYPIQMDSLDAFGYGSQELFTIYSVHSLGAIVGSSVASFLINYPFKFLFRYGNKAHLRDQMYCRERRMVPLKVIRVTWCIMIFWIIAVTSYLMLYGFWIPYHTNIILVQHIIASLMFSMFVLENIGLIISKLILERYYRQPPKKYVVPKILDETEAQRRAAYASFGEVLFRPYFKTHYEKMPYESYIKKKQMIQERMDVMLQIKSMSIFFFFVVLIYVFVFLEHDPYIIAANVSMERMVAGLGTDYNLYNIISIDDIYNYINKTLFANVYKEEWYEGWKIRDGGLMSDCNTKVLGIIQFRQQRTTQNCYWPAVLKGVDAICHNEASDMFSTNKSFYDGYGISSVFGRYQTYTGEGYVVHLGRSYKNSLLILETLKTRNWIDVNTKAFFIEFWTFNVNAGIFNLVTVIIERHSSGRLEKSTAVRTAHLITTDAFQQICLLTVFGLLLLVVVIMIMNQIYECIKRFRDYAELMWNLLDFILIVLAAVALYVSWSKEVFTEALLKELEKNDNNVFVYYFNVKELIEWRYTMLGFLIFLVTMRIWKFFRFALLFQLFEKSLFSSFKEAAVVFSYHLIIYLTLAYFFNVCLGHEMKAFRNFPNSIASVFLISLNFIEDFDPKKVDNAGPQGFLLYVVLIVCSVIFYNFYCTVFLFQLIQSKAYYSNKRMKYNILNLFSDEGRFYYEKRKVHRQNFRFRAGGEDDGIFRLVTPKAPAQRYANLIQVSKNKILLMRLIAIRTVRREINHFTHLRDTDYFLAVGIIRLLQQINKAEPDFTLDELDAGAGANNIFFFAPEGGKMKFVSNLTLLQMERYTETLLQHGVERLSDPKPTLEPEKFVLHMSGDADRLGVLCEVVSLIVKNLEGMDLEIEEV